MRHRPRVDDHPRARPGPAVSHPTSAPRPRPCRPPAPGRPSSLHHLSPAIAPLPYRRRRASRTVRSRSGAHAPSRRAVPRRPSPRRTAPRSGRARPTPPSGWFASLLLKLSAGTLNRIPVSRACRSSVGRRSRRSSLVSERGPAAVPPAGAPAAPRGRLSARLEVGAGGDGSGAGLPQAARIRGGWNRGRRSGPGNRGLTPAPAPPREAPSGAPPGSGSSPPSASGPSTAGPPTPPPRTPRSAPPAARADAPA